MHGIGVDIINISRMEETLERTGDLFIKRVFTESEQKVATAHHNHVIYYATAFAAKEAIFKLLGISWKCGIDFLDIEVFRGSNGEPLVELNGRIKELFEEVPVDNVSLSLSYDGDIAIAVAALNKKDQELIA
jgi:holo-[acyl-carrier protein] synthase